MRHILLFLMLLIPALNSEANSAYRFDNLLLEKEAKVSCISFSKNGSLWLGLDGSGLARRDSKDSRTIFYSRLAGTLPTDIVLCTYLDTRGRQWFGSFGDGPFWFENGNFRKLEVKNIHPNELSYISGISKDEKGNMWFATTMKGLFVVRKDGSWSNFCKNNSALETNTLTDLQALNRHSIVVATGWGIYLLDTDNGKINPLRDDKGNAFLQGCFVRTLCVSSDGNLWIGTRNGIYIFQINKHTWRHLTTDNGLADNNVIALAQDEQKGMWAVSPKSISLISKNNKITAFDESTFGQQEFHVRAAACAPDGKMFFGTAKGLLMATYNPTETANHSLIRIILGIAGLVVVLIMILYFQRRNHQQQDKALTSKDEEATAQEHLEIKEETNISSADEAFMQKIYQLISDNMSNTDYSVEELSADVGMTRGNLYKRILAITGMSPFELMRKQKIAKGKMLLDKQSGNISEIAWSVGLSPKQFSKYFKDEYGVLPSQFVKRQDKNNTQ